MKAGAIALIIIIAIILIFMIVGIIWDKKAKTYDPINYNIDEDDEDGEDEANDNNKIYYD